VPPHSYPSASDSASFSRHCALYKLNLLTYLLTAGQGKVSVVISNLMPHSTNWFLSVVINVALSLLICVLDCISYMLHGIFTYLKSRNASIYIQQFPKKSNHCNLWTHFTANFPKVIHKFSYNVTLH